MPKFYIASGQISFIVTAADAEGAALWAMNQSIDEQLPLDQVNWNELTPNQLNGILEGLSKFGDWICVSQIGIGRDEAARLKTEQVYLHWRQLLRAVDHLFGRVKFEQ